MPPWEPASLLLRRKAPPEQEVGDRETVALRRATRFEPSPTFARTDTARKPALFPTVYSTSLVSPPGLVGQTQACRRRDGEPDIVESPEPVADTAAVRSQILDWVGQLVEPGIEGIQAREVEESQGSKSGFVVVFVPLEIFLKHIKHGKLPGDQSDYEFVSLGITNSGRAIAKFPSIRFQPPQNVLINQFGIDGNCNFGLPRRPSEKDWIVFRGGIDDVIYPETTVKIAELCRPIIMLKPQVLLFGTPDCTFVAEVSCENMETKTLQQVLEGMKFY